MSDRLAMAALRYAANIEKLDEAADIIEALHQIARLAGLNMLGAWQLPSWARRGDRRAYKTFAHPSFPAAYWSEFWELYAKHGRSFMAQMAWRNREAFTMTEALRIVKPTGNERWGQLLLYRHGARDVFYVSNGSWMVVYWASKPLRLDVRTRAALEFMAKAAAARLQALPGNRRHLEPDPGLSARQRAALRLLSEGYTTAEIATQLEIAHGTAKEHIGRAVKKLGARNQIHAVAEAMRRYVVITWLAAMTLATAAGLCDVHHPDCWITHILDGRHSHVPGSTRVGL